MNRKYMQSAAALLVVFIGLVFASQAVAEEDANLTRFADALAKLRAEVESLSGDVDAAKEEQRNQLRSLASQRMDLELQAQREERRMQQIQAQATKQRETVDAEDSATKDLGPAVTESITTLRGQIGSSLPFKRGERLAALDTIETNLKQGLLSPQKASSRLWAFVEDELRLTRENGLYRQTITLGGDELLVDVARVGMVAMYFKTDDGRYGRTVNNGGAWSYELVQGKESQKQIEGLFDAFKKNIRVGFFELPNALPEGGAR